MPIRITAMHQLVIDNPELIRRIEDRARERGVSVETVLLEAVPERLEASSLDLPDAETLATKHGLTVEEAATLIDDATWREWTKDDVVAEIEWLQLVRANPGVAKRTLPGMVEHMMRITQKPEHVRKRLAALPDYNDEIYDEFGLPK